MGKDHCKILIILTLAKKDDKNYSYLKISEAILLNFNNNLEIIYLTEIYFNRV